MKVNANSIFDASEKWRTRTAFDVWAKNANRSKCGQHYNASEK